MEVKTREAAEQAAKRGAELSALLACTIARRDNLAVALEKRFGGTISQLSAEITAIEDQLADWSRAIRREFGDKQSLELPCAVLSFHAGGRSIEELPRWTWGKVIGAMRRLLSWRKYVRVKFEVDRRRILADTAGEKPKLKPDRLKKVGMRIVQGPETFAVEFRLKTKLIKKT